MKNKKICLIVPSLQMGGMERVVSLLANYASKNGYQVFIICLITSKPAYKINHDVHIIEPKFNFNEKKFNKLFVFNYLVRSLVRIKPNVSLSFSEAFNPLSVIAARITNTRIYISDRSSPHVKLKKTRQLLRKLTYPLAKGMIAQTDTAKAIFRERSYNNKIKVIPNPLKEMRVSNNSLDSNIVVSVGRLIPSKNFKELIEVFHKADIKKEWKLLIVGDGPEKKNLTNLINNLGLNDRVELIGAVEDIDYYLSISSVFAFTSISEGFPNALSEAIASPLPCISYDIIAGPSDLIVNGDNGFLIPVNEKELYISQLIKLMGDKGLRSHFVRNHDSHRNKFNAESVCKSYFDFIIN